MKLSEVPWGPYDPKGGLGGLDTTAEVVDRDGRKVRLWRPGSYGCDVELRVDNGKHEFLTALEALCRLKEIGARLPER